MEKKSVEERIGEGREKEREGERREEGARSLDRGHLLRASERREELDALAVSKANCMESRHRDVFKRAERRECC